MGKQPNANRELSSRSADPTRRRTEPTFIEPMQAKPVAELPPGEAVDL